MSEQLFDLIKQFGGEAAVSAMAAKVGLSPEMTQTAMAALMPALAGGLTQHVATDGGDGLNAAAAAAATTDHTSDAGIAQGTSILGSLFGSSDVTNAVTARAASATGIDQSQIASLLPMLATLATGALAHGAAAGVNAPPAADSGGIGGMLSGMLGKLTGGSAPATAGAVPGGAAGTLLGMLDLNKDGNPMDDIMGMLGKLRH